MEFSLVNNKVEQFGSDEESNLVIFFSGGQLSIFNPVIFRGINKSLDLIGQTVISHSETKDWFLLEFSRGAELEISLLDQDFRGPEAMTYYGNNGVIVVWN